MESGEISASRDKGKSQKRKCYKQDSHILSLYISGLSHSYT